MKDYYNFIMLCEDGIVNPMPTLKTSYYKRHPPVDTLNRPIKFNPSPPIFDMVTPLFNDTKLITSVTTEKTFLSPAHSIMIKKG